MKPLIALTPSLEKSSGNTYMNPGYLRGVTMAGGLPLILPLSCEGEDLDRLLSLCGGVLFTGGPDVDPAVYGEARLNESVELCPERDALEFSLLEKAMRAGLPVLGICRGCQLINTALGGTLYQDLPTQRPGPIQHRQPEPFTCPQHENRILPGTPLAAALSHLQRSPGTGSSRASAMRAIPISGACSGTRSACSAIRPASCCSAPLCARLRREPPAPKGKTGSGLGRGGKESGRLLPRRTGRDDHASHA